MRFFKYQGAGNDFLIADNRNGAIKVEGGVLFVTEQDGAQSEIAVSVLCDRRYGVGADGLMLLDAAPEDSGLDFKMTYFNSDGSGGMMCGNGGRCIVAFAADCGITHFDFLAADGLHSAQIMDDGGVLKIVRLKMTDVKDYTRYESLSGVQVASDGYFLDTGTRHFVRFVDGLKDYDVVGEGRDIRWNAAELQPIGANVNFVECIDGKVHVRTYEKGVEDETFACGTGIVASCLAAYAEGFRPSLDYLEYPSLCPVEERVVYQVQAKRDGLIVDFRPTADGNGLFAEDVWLTGPAAYVAEILV